MSNYRKEIKYGNTFKSGVTGIPEQADKGRFNYQFKRDQLGNWASLTTISVNQWTNSVTVQELRSADCRPLMPRLEMVFYSCHRAIQLYYQVAQA
jgi:hypothetical protein